MKKMVFAATAALIATVACAQAAEFYGIAQKVMERAEAAAAADREHHK